jgi:hypothetical protein
MMAIRPYYRREFIFSTVFDIDPNMWNEPMIVDEILDGIATRASGDDTKTIVTKAIMKERQTWDPYHMSQSKRLG